MGKGLKEEKEKEEEPGVISRPLDIEKLEELKLIYVRN